ncbi:hypothetical protein IGI04_029953 [Brassica rapa subsp. trilocularis]|uniref:Uncharacterized protein n=1 Tax=Brassica rapa subsp. trilocularis TaxID=1813537 RepID=A0ABQ7LPB1_BRACM|nr:hypothetical protein IGI04_029953 [Brassica rapa subsp. trilocularis]
MCAKQVISLVETMKSVFFPRSVRPDNLHVSRLAVDDLHGSLLVNADTIYTEVGPTYIEVGPTTYIEVVMILF